MADRDLNRDLRNLNKQMDDLQRANQATQRNLEQQQARNQQRIADLQAENERARQENEALFWHQVETQQEIDDLKKQRAQDAQKYAQQLKALSEQQQRNMDRANRTMAEQHARQMAEIEAQYSRARSELNEKIRTGLRRLEEMQKAALKQQSRRIDAMEKRLDEDEARSRQIADESMARMEADWQALRQREELQPFVTPHEEPYKTAETQLKTIYDLRQYQAVTGIAVNSCTLIQSWKAEAESLQEERQEVLALCSAQAGYMEKRLADAAVRQPITCDGKDTRVVLQRYDEEGFREMNAQYREAASQLDHPETLTLQQARDLLARLETCRTRTDALLTRVMQRHLACVRRSVCKARVEKGMKKRKYGLEKAEFLDQDFQQGIRLQFRNEYQGTGVQVCIRTQDPATGQTLCEVTLLNGTRMDEQGQIALCGDLSEYIGGLLQETEHNAPATAVQRGNVYREQGGFYRSNILVQMH